MAGHSSYFSLFSALCVLIFVDLFVFDHVEGFSVDLIHRDTPKSPYHYPLNSDHFERLNNAFRRSISRAHQFKKRNLDSKHLSADLSEPIQSLITPATGEYLMELSIGTPPFDILAIADTGSDLTWTQCKPCDQCYKQDAPLFDPRKTRTYRKLSCDAKLCQDAGGESYCDEANNCQYRYSYGDSSYSIGDLSVETFTFQSSSGKNISIPKVVFGCGHENGGTFNGTGSGIIGLGGGPVSIVNQLGNFVSGKFSYCLVPLGTESNVSSKISFGRNAIIVDSSTVSTPLIRKVPETYYYLNLEGISVQEKTFTNKGFSRNATSFDSGNIIIDSGTTLTFLPREIYEDLESSLKETISGRVVADPEGLLGLCYKFEEDIKFPDLVVHFTDADVVLPETNTFLRVNEDTICFTMIPTDDLAIFGNLSQMDYLIGYDLVNKKVTFKPTDCTKYN